MTWESDFFASFKIVLLAAQDCNDGIKGSGHWLNDLVADSNHEKNLANFHLKEPPNMTYCPFNSTCSYSAGNANLEIYMST